MCILYVIQKIFEIAHFFLYTYQCYPGQPGAYLDKLNTTFLNKHLTSICLYNLYQGWSNLF